MPGPGRTSIATREDEHPAEDRDADDAHRVREPRERAVHRVEPPRRTGFGELVVLSLAVGLGLGLGVGVGLVLGARRVFGVRALGQVVVSGVRLAHAGADVARAWWTVMRVSQRNSVEARSVSRRSLHPPRVGTAATGPAQSSAVSQEECALAATP